MSVSNSGMTLYINNDNDTGWTGEDGTSIEVFWQGSGSQKWIVSKSATETAILTLSADLSSAKYFTLAMLSTIAPFYTSIKARMETDASNYEEFVLSDQTAGATYRAIDGMFKFSTSVLQFGQGTTTGTYNRASHTVYRVTVDNTSSGNIRSVENHYTDAMYYGNGRSIGGTTTGDKLFSESDALNISGDVFDCCTFELGGEVFAQTDLYVTTTTGNSYGETLVFKIAPNTDNIYTLSITGTAAFVNTSIKAESGATIDLDTSASTAFAMTGGAVTNGGDIAFKSGNTITGVPFTTCAEIDTNGATMSGCTISDTTETTTGSLIINSSTEGAAITDMQFKTYSNNSRYAIYVPAAVTSFTMDNWQFDDPNNTTDYALYWAGTGGTLTISSTNNTNLATAGCTSAGGTVAISQDVTVEVKNVVVGSLVHVATLDGNGDESTVLLNVIADTATEGTTVNYAGLDYTAVTVVVRKGTTAPKYFSYRQPDSISSSGMSHTANQRINTIAN